MAETDHTRAYILALYANVIAQEKREYMVASRARAGAMRRFRAGRVDSKRAHALLGAACRVDSRRSCLVHARLLYDQVDLDAVLAIANRLCASGYVPACLTSGFIYEKKDIKRSVRLYTGMCKRGEAFACYRLGQAYALGQGVARDTVKAVQMQRRLCASNPSFGCLGLAVALKAFQYKDRPAVRKSLQKSCDANNGQACIRLAELHVSGKGGSKTPVKARAILGRACNVLGFQQACLEWTRLIREGVGGPKNPEKEAQIWERSCFLDFFPACNNLGIYYSRGTGVTRDVTKAHELYRYACDGGNPHGCANLGKAYMRGDGVTKDRAVGLALLERACLGGRGLETSCVSLRVHTMTPAQHSKYRRDKWLRRRNARADALALKKKKTAQKYARDAKRWVQECNGTPRSVGACYSLADAHRQKHITTLTDVQALAYYDLACGRPWGQGCLHLGELLQRGAAPIVTSDKAAFRAYQRGCKDEVMSCLALAKMYRNGTGTRRNVSKANTLVRKACKDNPRLQPCKNR